MTNFHGKFVTFRIREVTFARKHKEKHVFLWCFAHLFVILHKICARTGCTSAKSELSALGLHRPCHTPFHKGTTLYCSISHTNCDLERDFTSKIKYYIEAALHSAVSNHSVFGAVQGPAESMGRGLRFLYAHTDSAPPYQTLMREL